MSYSRLDHDFKAVLSCLEIEDDGGQYGAVDNLAVAIATYFDGHQDKPNTDEIDDETGWHPWVVKKTDWFLNHLGKTAEALHNERNTNEQIGQLCADKRELVDLVHRMAPLMECMPDWIAEDIERLAP